MTTTYSRDYWMELALELAYRGQLTVFPNPAVGCVIVKDNQVLGQGWHKQAGENHAEQNAIEYAISQGHNLEQACVYVTLEPCNHFGQTSPCTQALADAGVKQVVVACLDPDARVSGKGLAALQQRGIQTELLDQASDIVRKCLDLNCGYLKFKQQQRPWVRLKSAQSLDGRISLFSGESQWISDECSRADAHYWRARSQAIMSTAETVIQDNAKLTVRLNEQQLKKYGLTVSPIPTKIILDRQLRLTSDLALFAQVGEVIIYCSDKHNKEAQQTYLKQFTQPIKLYEITETEQGLDLTKLFTQLADLSYYEILIEAGGTLAGACVEQALVDEIILYIAPKLLGKGVPAFDIADISHLSEAKVLRIISTQQLAQDIRVVLQCNLVVG